MKKTELTNFIPINRKLFQHHLWNEERAFSRFEAWIYLLKEARFEDTKLYDKNKVVTVKRGQLYASIRFISTAFGWSTKKTGNFLKLLEDDQMIRKETVKETGQMRLTICNYDVYNSQLSDRKHEEKHNGNETETKSKSENKAKESLSPLIAPSSGEVSAEKADTPTWRDSFEVYLSELTDAYKQLQADKAFVRERERFRPNVDILLSLEKAFRDYWSTPQAWEKRKKSRSKSLDWRTTFRNSLDQPMNQVYKQKTQQQYANQQTTTQNTSSGKPDYNEPM